MTVHFHGGPITPHRELLTLAGRHFCVSFARPDQVKAMHELGQSVLLDNGAFSFWRGIAELPPAGWPAYYEFCDRWLEHRTTWAVIPDVIDGTLEDNDELIAAWPFGARGAPVWHLHEPLARLRRLCEEWPRVCIGSSGAYAKIASLAWHRRMTDVMDELCGNGPPPTWLHMLRGMALAGEHYPFASLDSTDVGRNHNREQNTALSLAARWDAMQCPPRWTVRGAQLDLAVG